MDNGNHGVTFTYQRRVKEADLLELVARLEARELVAAAGAVADRYASVAGDQWARTGRRSDGARFTVDTLGRYHLHDVEHHLYDVGS